MILFLFFLLLRIYRYDFNNYLCSKDFKVEIAFVLMDKVGD